MLRCPACDWGCHDEMDLMEHVHMNHDCLPYEGPGRSRLACVCGWTESGGNHRPWLAGYQQFIEHCHSTNDLYEHLTACLVTKALASGGVS